MRQKGTGWVLVSEADLRDIVRDEIRKELRHHREEMLEAVRSGTPPPKSEPDSDELLTAEEVAQALKVRPDTVRFWIQSGSLVSCRRALAPQTRSLLPMALGKGMRRLGLTAILSASAIVGGCHRQVASAADCRAVLDRLVELELKESG